MKYVLVIQLFLGTYEFDEREIADGLSLEECERRGRGFVRRNTFVSLGTRRTYACEVDWEIKERSYSFDFPGYTTGLNWSDWK